MAAGVQIQRPWAVRSLAMVMSSALRAAKRVLRPVPGRQFPGATPLPVGGRRQGLTYPDAGLVDDGAPSGAIVLNVPLKELGGGPGTLTVPDDASGGSAGDGLRGKARAAVGGSTPPLSVSSGRRATGFEEGTAGSPGKLVPITRDFLHYLEPSPHAVKRKNREAGSKFGRYRNRKARPVGRRLRSVSLNPSTDPTRDMMILGRVLEQGAVVRKAKAGEGTWESGIRPFLTLRRGTEP